MKSKEVPGARSKECVRNGAKSRKTYTILGGGGRPQPAKAYCRTKGGRRRWQQTPNEGPRGGYLHGLELGRRTSRGGGSYGTADRQPSALLRLGAIHPARHDCLTHSHPSRALAPGACLGYPQTVATRDTT